MKIFQLPTLVPSTLLIGVTLLSAAFTMPAVASDLIEIYDLAKQNDRQWQASQAAYKADRETSALGLANLKPVINFSASTAKSSYTSDNPIPKTDDITNAFSSCGDDLLNFAECFEEALETSEGSSGTQKTTSSKYSLSMQQPLFRMDKWHDYKKSKEIKHKAEHELEAERQALIIRVSQAYFNVLRSQEDQEFALTEKKSIKEQLHLAKKRYGLGLSRETDVYDAQAAFDIAKANTMFAETAFAVQRRNLEVLTGQPFGDLTRLKDNMPVEPPQPDNASDWVTQAVSNNPALQAAVSLKLATVEDYKKQKAGHYPTMNLFATYSNSSSGSGLPSSTSKSIGIDFNLPLYTGGATSSNIKKANYRVEESRGRVSYQRLQIESQVQNLHLTVKSDVHRIAARKNAIKSNGKSLTATQESYTAGVRTILDLFQSQRTLLAAKRDYAGARYDYIINSLKLKQVTGILKESDLTALNSWLEN